MARSQNPSVARWGLSHTHPAFRPYVVALGQLTLAWNELHEAMALLFCSVMGGGYANQFLAVWHSINSDRNQRAVLVAAAENDINRPASDMRHKEVVEKIKWICGQANTLEDLRNDSLHSPLIARGQQVVPMSGLGHIPRANYKVKPICSQNFAGAVTGRNASPSMFVPSMMLWRMGRHCQIN